MSVHHHGGSSLRLAPTMKESLRQPSQSITQLLVKWGSGDKAALDELMPLVYDELRRLAASYLRRRSDANTLQATALVHEAYVRLADQSSISMEHRAQFFGLAAKVMRDILVDHAAGVWRQARWQRANLTQPG